MIYYILYEYTQICIHNFAILLSKIHLYDYNNLDIVVYKGLYIYIYNIYKYYIYI